MKRVALIFLVLMLICSAVYIPVLSEGTMNLSSQEDTAVVGGIDVVIVLDQTTSMRRIKDGNLKGNDIEGYRLDAAAMLIGMLDRKASRVAIVTFNEKASIDKNWTQVNTPDKCIDLFKTLSEKKEKGYFGVTNISTGIKKAVELLDDRSDKTNKPMIILLTDGENQGEDTNDEQIKSRYDSDTRKAIDSAAEKKYPIYTIGLGRDASDVSFGNSYTLKSIPEKTGVLGNLGWFQLSDSEQLPNVFARILANHIGSSLDYQAPAKKEPSSKNKEIWYTVEIPISNQEVEEINIVIPLGKNKNTHNIDPNSIQIIDSKNNKVTDSNRAYTLNYDKGHFAMIKILKITNPEDCGNWRIRFKASDELKGDPSFNILYNYNVKLYDELTVENDDSGREFYYKTDTLKLKAYFGSSKGQMSKDYNLYKNFEEPYKWLTITASYSLFDSDNDNNVLQDSVEMQPKVPSAANEYGYYESTVFIEGMKDGKYTLKIVANGGGLHREIIHPFSITNRKPTITQEFLNQNNTIPIQVNNPANSDYGLVKGKISLNNILIDDDKDTITIMNSKEEEYQQGDTIESDSNNGIINLSYDPVKKEFSYSTVQDSSRTKQKTGKETYTIYYSDGDTGKGSLKITFDVQSVEESLSKDNQINLDITDASNNTLETFPKNSEMNIHFSVINKKTNDLIDLSIFGEPQKEAKITATGPNGQTISVELSLSKDKKSLIGKVNSGNKEGKWTITAKMDPFRDAKKEEVEIINHSPQAKPETDAYNIFFNKDKVFSFLSWIPLMENDTEETEAARILNTEDTKSNVALIQEDDDEKLIFDPPSFSLTDKAGNELPVQTVAGDVIRFEKTENGYSITPAGNNTGLFHYDFDGKVTLTAKDGDEEQATYVRQIHVRDTASYVYSILIIAVSALIILIALILIIRQICKPYFPKLSVELRQGQIALTSTKNLPHSKKQINVINVGLGGTIAKQYGISSNQLQNILISPIKSNNNAVCVVCKKIEPNHSIMMNGVEMKAGKKYDWRRDFNLTIKIKAKQDGVTLRLIQRVNRVNKVN